jgi:hypothetical protein
VARAPTVPSARRGAVDGPDGSAQSKADAAFIAASRTLVPRLLAEVDRQLRARTRRTPRSVRPPSM